MRSAKLSLLLLPVHPSTNAGPGHWNDPEMLEVGNGGMSITEYTSHFSLWCIMAAPLIAGNDLRKMKPAIRGILTNKEAIAIDQDPAGIQGNRVWKNGDLEIWLKPLGSADGKEKAVLLLNRGKKPVQIKMAFKVIGLPEKVFLRDLWKHKDIGNKKDSYTVNVESHGVVFLRVKGAD